MRRGLVAALDRGDHEKEDGYLNPYAELPSYLDNSSAFWRGE
jgi:hypothetical protein